MNWTQSRGRAAWGAVVLALVMAGGVACSGSKNAGSGAVIATGAGGQDGGDDSGAAGSGAPVSPWVELTLPSLDVQGGSARSAGGQAKDGGNVHVLALGDVTFDPTVPPAAAPTIPTAPADATAVTANALGADVNASGSIVVSADVVAGGSDAVLTITSTGGDIFVSAKLRGADLGGTRQGIHLVANGTVFVTGAVDTSGGSGTGQAGGALQISAQQVVVTGKLASAGGQSSTTGGAAGAVGIAATSSIFVAGLVDCFGGDAQGPAAVTGGAAGAFSLQAGGDVVLAATVRMRGGAAASTGADAQGGAGAVLALDSNGNVQVAGIVDARGGRATATTAGGAVVGGAAGTIKVGEGAAPKAVAVLVAAVATGGDGDATGGNGGNITLEPGTGTLTLAGVPAADATGGGSLSKPGTGGTVQGSPRTDPGSGGVHITGIVAANGGGILAGGSGNGGDAGHLTFELTPTLGPFMLDASAQMTVDGGTSRGAGVAGGGGHAFIFTKDGDLTVAGTISARGGIALDDGGTGGGGGMVYCFSDNNHNALYNTLGNLLIAPSGVIDASGGDGTKGGDARSDGKQWSVPVFPDHQEQIAVFLNCDGIHGETHNWMNNQGHIIVRGGAHNGNGGDVVYHGIGPGQLGSPLASGQSQHHPPSGNLDKSGDGSGVAGDFLGE